MARLTSKKRLDSVLILLVVILVAAVAVQFIFNRNNKIQSPANTASDNQPVAEQVDSGNKDTVNISVDFGDGKKYNQSVKAGTAFSALQSIASNQGFDVNYKEYKYGLIVDTINRTKNSPERFWQYSVNGQLAQIAADRYILSSGDKVEWKYVSVK